MAYTIDINTVIKYFRMMYTVTAANDERFYTLHTNFCELMGWDKTNEDVFLCVGKIFQENREPNEIIDEHIFADDDNVIDLHGTVNLDYAKFMRMLMKVINDKYVKAQTEYEIADTYYKILLLHEKDKTRELVIFSGGLHEATRDRINNFIKHPWSKSHENWRIIFQNHLENLNSVINDILLI